MLSNIYYLYDLQLQLLSIRKAQDVKVWIASKLLQRRYAPSSSIGYDDSIVNTKAVPR